MVTKGVLCLAVLVALATGTTCPMYTCDSTLATNVCASWTSGQNFKLNNGGCASGYYCMASTIATWAAAKGGSGTGDSTQNCLATPTTTTTVTWTTKTCATHQANKNFQNNSTIVYCTSSIDCTLADGTTKGACGCGFRSDGQGVCVPERSNDILFGGYWTDCGTTGTISSETTYYYWESLIAYWVYEQGAVACTTTFLEKLALDTYTSDYNDSAALVFGLAALLY